MRKMILMGLIAATTIPSLAQAQSAGELRHDDRAIQQERRELHDAKVRGDRHDIREERQDLRRAKDEKREDWQDYRRAHRDVYRRQAYVGPRGYVYRPVAVGYRFAPSYYGSRYVISDPWRYRLANRPGARWVRYGNDAVLVGPRGHVIEVNRDFFW